MGFGDAISTCFGKYATFQGRAARPEYWYFVLFTVLVDVVLEILNHAILGGIAAVLQGLFGLAVLLPTIAVAVRRLHDLDRSGWWLLIGLIPVVGGIVLLIWFCLRGTEGRNRFG